MTGQLLPKITFAVPVLLFFTELKDRVLLFHTENRQPHVRRLNSDFSRSEDVTDMLSVSGQNGLEMDVFTLLRVSYVH